MNIRILLSVAVITVSGALWDGRAAAGENTGVRLAMHCVASDRYLGCPSDCPQSCEEIDWDFTPEELATSFDQGTIYLVAYNVSGLSGIEFALEVVSGSGASFEEITWCGSAPAFPSLGDVWRGGRIVTWGNAHCLEPQSADGGVVFGRLRVDFSGMEPTIIDYAPSNYSDASFPHNYALNCTDDFAEDPVVQHHGAVIYGHGFSIGNPCEGGPVDELQTWSEMKSMYRY